MWKSAALIWDTVHIRGNNVHDPLLETADFAIADHYFFPNSDKKGFLDKAGNETNISRF